MHYIMLMGSIYVDSLVWCYPRGQHVVVIETVAGSM